MAAARSRAGRRGGAGGGHSTATACWDGAVVLADLLYQPSSVLLSHSPTWPAPSAYAGGDGPIGVLELGCSISALPALVASLQGARRVVATDANDAVLRVTRENARQWLADHPSATPLSAAPLRWGEDEDVRAAGGVGRGDHLRRHPGGRLRVRVGEPTGAWGKLLTTIAALSTPTTLNLRRTRTAATQDVGALRGAARVEALPRVVPVAPPAPPGGAAGRPGASSSRTPPARSSAGPSK